MVVVVVVAGAGVSGLVVSAGLGVSAGGVAAGAVGVEVDGVLGVDVEEDGEDFVLFLLCGLVPPPHEVRQNTTRTATAIFRTFMAGPPPR